MRPFRRTLIVKLMGRRPAYGFMVKKLRQLWERKGNIDIFDLENDFYLVNFQSMEDYMGALTGGPWVILDAYLNVTRWYPDFCPKKEQIESVVAWVRFPDLPAPLFDKKFLLNLGNAIGKAIRLDVHTAQRARGKFARMCVELDLTKPLVPEFNVEGQVLSVVYESLSTLCRKCGRVGHTRDACAVFHNKREVTRMDVEVEEKEQQEVTGRDVETDLWKTVQRNRRPRKSMMPAQNLQTGSRFSVLNEEEVEEGTTKGLGQMAKEKEVDPKIVQREGPNKQQRKKGTNGGPGEKRPVLEAVKDNKMGASSKNGLKEKMETSRGLAGATKEGMVDYASTVSQCVPPSVKFNPESNLDLTKGHGCDMANKENLHPGEYCGRSRRKDDMDTAEMQDIGDEDPCVSHGLTNGKGLRGPRT
ncbi:hypothetical protein K1719_042036 [Acacia pycnantha]|nr:hypothetical protein K1719_042036 [Acacia pycnantha]